MKYLVAEVNVNKIDGANVKYLSNRPGYPTLGEVDSSFLKVFETIEDAQKAIEYANQCVVEAKWL